MREILFRGKRVDNGEWVEGDLIHTSSVNMGVKSCHTLIGFDMDLWEVVTETVGQYTGLNDKNGRRIFEYDIVSEIGMYLISKFSNGSFNFVTMREKMVVSSVDTTQYAVIGNIHDNPEFLKK